MGRSRTREGGHERSRRTRWSRSRSKRRDAEDDDEVEDWEADERQRQRDRQTPHFKWSTGQLFGPQERYVIQSQLGEGTFGRVLGCLDALTKEAVAVKVVKGVKRYCEDAEIEADVLREIVRRDQGRRSHCVRLLDTFVHPVLHYCIVSERLDMSLRDLLKSNKNRGLLIQDIRIMAQQLLECLEFIHSIGLVHTDLKCRNVMLRDATSDLVALPRASADMSVKSPRNCDIAVIDFGGACFRDDWHDGFIGTRQYRSPETILGLEWDEKADLWSAGCIITMLYTGSRPFQVHESMEHIALIERFVGAQMPRSMVKGACSSGPLPDDLEFDDNGVLVWPGDADDEAVEHVKDAEPLATVVRPKHKAFLALLRGLLDLDPASRLGAAAALRLEFFTDAALSPE